MKQTKKVNYIYIDDFADSSVIAIKDGLNDTQLISVEFYQVSDFKEMINQFEGPLKKFDGIILDLRLDKNSKIDVKFTASSLAQELRNRCAANEGIKDTPIILCSTDRKIRQYYNVNHTSHDLFDYRFVKSAKPDWEKIAKKLQAIAKGYEVLKASNGDMSKILNRETSSLDSRILGKFINKQLKFPLHEYSQYILKDLIKRSGPLIKEEMLAARLGIDIDQSPDWLNLKSVIYREQKYNGVFSETWERWWMDLVIGHFKTLTGKRLATLNAEQRVHSLIKATKLRGLVAAKPINKSISTNFWTICEFFKQPLDPLEGYRIQYINEPKPWQDQMYLSFEAASERKGIKDGLCVHPDDAEKLSVAKRAQRKS